MKTSTLRNILPHKKESHLPVQREEMEAFGLLRREIDRLFEDFTRGFTFEPLRLIETRTRRFSPTVDVSEFEKNVTVNVELLKRRKRKRKRERATTETERSFGESSRVIPLPVGVDTNKVSTVFKKGLLNITIPRTKGTKTTS
jgi:HSP20 family protein